MIEFGCREILYEPRLTSQSRTATAASRMPPPLPVELLQHIAKELQALHPYSLSSLASTNRLMWRIVGPLAAAYTTVKAPSHVSQLLERAVNSPQWADHIRGIVVFRLPRQDIELYLSVLRQGPSLFPRCTEVVLGGAWSIKSRDMANDMAIPWMSVETFKTLSPCSITEPMQRWFICLFPFLQVANLSAMYLTLDPFDIRYALNNGGFRHVHTLLVRGEVCSKLPYDREDPALDVLGRQFPSLRSLTLSPSPKLERSRERSASLARFITARLVTLQELAITTSLESFLWEELDRTAEAQHPPVLRTLDVVLGAVSGLHTVLGFIAKTNGIMEARIRYCTGNKQTSVHSRRHRAEVDELDRCHGRPVTLPGLRVQDRESQQWYTLDAIRGAA